MCATMCGPMPDPPTSADRLRRLYVDRAPVNAFEGMLLRIYDRATPVDRDLIVARACGDDLREQE